MIVFDGFNITFQGFVAKYILYQLEQAQIEARCNQKPALTYLGTGNEKIPVHVAESGMRGGYSFRFDTGEDGETWAVADSGNSNRWNIRVSVKSLSLALHGYKDVKKNILNILKKLEAQGNLKDFSLEESISRFDYCFDFTTDNFLINPECILAHNNTKIQFIGNSELILKQKDIQYARIGKMPSRQIVFYNKKNEILEKKKYYWFKLWGIKKNFNKQIWRIEIRAGKKELKLWNLKTFSDFELKAGDILLDIANSIRYVKPNYKDKNKARWKNHEFWNVMINSLKKDLFEFSSNSKRNEIISVIRNQKINEYTNLIKDLIPPYMAVTARNFNELPEVLKELTENIQKYAHDFSYDFKEKLLKAEGKFILLD